MPQRPLGAAPASATRGCALPGRSPPGASRRSAPETRRPPDPVGRRPLHPFLPAALLPNAGPSASEQPVGRGKGSPRDVGAPFPASRPPRNSPTGRGRKKKRTTGAEKRKTSLPLLLFSPHCPSADPRGPDHLRGRPSSSVLCVLLPSLYLPRRRPFLPYPTHFFSLQPMTPTPRSNASHAPPPIVWPVLIVRCPVPSVVPPPPHCSSPSSPAPHAPHISSLRRIPHPPPAWVLSHDPPEIRCWEWGRVALRSWHSSALFQRTQVPRTAGPPPLGPLPAPPHPHTQLPGRPHPRAPLVRISTLDLGVSSAP